MIRTKNGLFLLFVTVAPHFACSSDKSEMYHKNTTDVFIDEPLTVIQVIFLLYVSFEPPNKKKPIGSFLCTAYC